MRIAAVAMCVVLAGCASGGSAIMGGGRPQTPPSIAGQTFRYGPGVDRNLKVTVGRVVVAGEPDFIPQEAGWVQVHLTITNVGKAMPTILDVRERRRDGTIIQAARSSAELQKKPNYVSDTASGMGIVTAGMAAGMFINPFLAPVGGAIWLGRTLRGPQRMMDTQRRVEETGLKADIIAPSTSVSGNVFLPAVPDQTALIIFYELDGQTRTLAVPRTGSSLPQSSL
jgi:hypothetical protein